MPHDTTPPIDDLFNDLNPTQQEAVQHMEGPLLILAGPGSGKTRVITRRVAYLISQGVRPQQILAITFTNKAADQMKRRVEALIPDSRAWISTFHSMGARLLRMYGDEFGIEKNFTIYDQNDRATVVKAAMEAADMDSVRFTPGTIMNAISKAKNQLISPPRYADTAKDFFQQTVAHIYPIYEQKLRDSNAFDFDDLLYWPAMFLKNKPEFREELDARFKYVMIDEYQDTNQAQYAIARALSMDEPNLCVVGDIDQSIYSFRGSDIRNILDFERDFSDARVITLGRDYRSTKSILKAADSVISNNRKRKVKLLTTENDEGQPVKVLQFESGIEEADGIASRIKAAVKNSDRHYRDYAVFLRVNALSRTLETAFVKNQVPFKIIRGFAFYDRKENRDVLAYLRVLVNPKDAISFQRIVNEPSRGVGKVSLQRLLNYAEVNEITPLSAAGQVDRITTIKGKAKAGLKDFHQTMTELQTHLEEPAHDIIRQVIDKTGYKDMFEKTSEEDQERLANVEELITAAKQFVEVDESRTLGDFLESVTLDAYDDVQDCVSVLTLHASKGLEFPVVYMVALEQGLLPHERSIHKDDELEEERRLTFVGMTRAMEELYMCHAKYREFRGQTLYAMPSMFLDELPAEGVDDEDLSSSTANRAKMMNDWRSSNPAADPGWIDAGILLEDAKSKGKDKGDSNAPIYREGMLVEHGQYGTGKVTSVGGVGAMQKVKVLFAKAGERTFLVRLAKLTIIEGK